MALPRNRTDPQTPAKHVKHPETTEAPRHNPLIYKKIWRTGEDSNPRPPDS